MSDGNSWGRVLTPIKIPVSVGSNESMTVEHDTDEEDAELGNGDTLAERLEKVDIESDETCSTEEMRKRLGL